MSKSTPISNLPNLKKQSPPAFEQRENDLVNEILSEIDNDKKGGAPQQPQGPSPEQIQMMQQQQQAMIQQQMLEQQLMEQQMREQQMAEQMNASGPNVEGVVANHTVEPKAFYEELLDTAKPSLLVAIIVAILSLPVLATVIDKAVASKESFKRFALPLTLLIKGAIGGGLFYGGSTALQL
jgi:hypothetical protein